MAVIYDSDDFLCCCLYQIVEDCDERLTSDAVDQFLEKIEEILPPIPAPEAAAAEDGEEEEQQPEGDEMEADV